jgi:acyl-CoA synthetase (AMP-forming)/AMP-acid ligase II
VSRSFWAGWSHDSWRRHLPDTRDISAFVTSLGEGTIHGLAHATATRMPDSRAVTIGEEVLTHVMIDEMAARAASHLRRRVKAGDRVMLAAPPSPRWIGCYLGILRAGAVAVVANPAYTPTELDGLAAVAEPALTLTDLEGELFSSDPEPWSESTTPDDLALLAFTSGTTGRPKGVPLTHRSLLTSIRSAMAAWHWSPSDILLHALPLFHQHGLGGLHATLIAGTRLHLMPEFTPEGLVSELERTKATVLFAVPTMYQRLPERRPFQNALRLCVSGSAPLGTETALRAGRLLGRSPLVRYGLTESGLDVSQVYREAAPAGTVGVALPGVLLRLAEDGEIQLRGPQVFGGYWRDQAANAAGFTADGWFRTGDIGRLDQATGELAIAGRTKEVIITGGMKVMPREVELVLERHPGIAEAAVAGLPSERWGEQVTAWVVTRPGAAFDPDAIIQHARASLAPYKVPKQVFHLDSLPRSHLGKVDRRRLEARPGTLGESSGDPGG